MTLALTPLLRRRLLIVAGLIFTLWATWQVSQDEAAPTVVAGPAVSNRRAANSKPLPPVPTLALVWPARADPHPPIADLFSLAPPVLPVVAAQAPAPPSQPAAPAFNLKYVGSLDQGDNNQAFLADAKDQIVVVKIGQTVDNFWQLTAINAQQLVFRHTATGQEHTLQIGTLQ